MRALVIGASGGIGRAVVAQLQADGWDVTPLSRRDDGFDITDAEAVRAGFGRLTGEFDLVFVAVGVLAPQGAGPEKTLSAIMPEHMGHVMAVNAIGPALVLGQIAGLLPKGRRAVVAVLSARVGSIGDNRIGGWYSYRASKAALNQIVHGAAIELGRSHKQSICVALHPGTVQTPFTADYVGRHKTVPAADAARNLLDVIASLGPAHSGGFYDYAGAEIPW